MSARRVCLDLKLAMSPSACMAVLRRLLHPLENVALGRGLRYESITISQGNAPVSC